jgi:GINS complex subunit 4
MRENEEEEDRNYELLMRLMHAIKQERLSPPLLPFEREAFEEVRLLVEDQRGKLKDFLRYEDENETRLSTKNFKYMIYNAEIEKVDYLLKTYLKTRLKKVSHLPCRYKLTASISSRTNRRPSSCSPSRS